MASAGGPDNVSHGDLETFVAGILPQAPILTCAVLATWCHDADLGSVLHAELTRFERPGRSAAGFVRLKPIGRVMSAVMRGNGD